MRLMRHFAFARLMGTRVFEAGRLFVFAANRCVSFSELGPSELVGYFVARSLPDETGQR